MARKHLAAYLWLLFSLQILESQMALGNPLPLPGKKKSFGVGMLSGALAGAVLTKALSNNPTQHHHYYGNNAGAPAPPAPPAAPAAPTIERGETLTNGCYKQTVTVPDPTDVRKFIKSEQLVCPGGAAVPAVPIASPAYPYGLPQIPSNLAVNSVPTPVYTVPAPVQPVAIQPILPLTVKQPEIDPNLKPVVPDATANQEAQSLMPPAVQPSDPVSVQNLQPGVPIDPGSVQSSQPAVPVDPSIAQSPQMVANNPALVAPPSSNIVGVPLLPPPFLHPPPNPAVTPHVVELSRKTGYYKKSSAAQIYRGYNIMSLGLVASFLIAFL